ncbi:BPTI/Kunitz-type proteinase inhibitor domain-containing protein [Luteibaculum oceani]|uniref:Proteinase inhibitor I4 serpin n=1 Tax=Luteibaculum oceani TaxID=1294296 RepID=A0A5C6V8K4_9FLAO|nr:BPTI/Kunitz-type proteinase inhibitor domain-containing protein [Luteibaculum oceani]TXC81347.1 proteinase inhibitor I4 serpin [Luteibaculum oceani]
MRLAVLLLFFAFGLISCEKEVKDCPAERCSLKPDAGPCEAAIKKYYYSRERNKCLEFTWGGCKGTVPFNTLADCQGACLCKD